MNHAFIAFMQGGKTQQTNVSVAYIWGGKNTTKIWFCCILLEWNLVIRSSSIMTATLRPWLVISHILGP